MNVVSMAATSSASSSSSASSTYSASIRPASNSALPVHKQQQQQQNDNYNLINNNNELNTQRILKQTYNSSEHAINKNQTKIKNSNNKNHKNIDSNSLSKETLSLSLSLGDLVWAKLSNFPWWPCKIVRDNLSDEYTKCVPCNNSNSADNSQRYFLVELFSGPSSGERAWLAEEAIFKYNGIESFKAYAQSQVDKAPTKAAKEKLVDRYQLKVSTNRREQWENAVKLADAFIRKEAEMRKNLKKNDLNLKRKREDSNTYFHVDDDREIKKQIAQQNEAKLNMTELKKKNSHSNCKKTSIMGETKKKAEVNKQQQVASMKHLALNSSGSTQTGDLEEMYGHEEGDDIDEDEDVASTDDENDDDDEILQPTSIYEYENEPIENNFAPNFDQSWTIQTSNETNNLIIKKKRGRKPKVNIEQGVKNNAADKSRSSSSSSSSGSSSCSSDSSTSCSSSSSGSTSSSSSSDGEDEKVLKNSSESLDADAINRQLSMKNVKKRPVQKRKTLVKKSDLTFDLNESELNFAQKEKNMVGPSGTNSTAETYLIDRYNYAVRHIQQGLSVEEACNKYRISKGALLKCLSGGTAPRGKKTRLTETEEKEIVDWLISNKDLKYNEAIHLVFEQVEKIFEQTQRPNPFHNGKPSMDWWYDFLSRHPQIMASKQDWLMRGKVNDQYIKDVQSGQLKCTKFRRALLSAIQYIHSQSENNTTTNFTLPKTSKPKTTKPVNNKTAKVNKASKKTTSLNTSSLTQSFPSKNENFTDFKSNNEHVINNVNLDDSGVANLDHFLQNDLDDILNHDLTSLTYNNPATVYPTYIDANNQSYIDTAYKKNYFNTNNNYLANYNGNPINSSFISNQTQQQHLLVQDDEVTDEDDEDEDEDDDDLNNTINPSLQQ